MPKLCLKRKTELIGSDNAFIFNLLSIFSYFLGNHGESGHIKGELFPLTSKDLRKLKASILNKFFPLPQNLRQAVPIF